MLNFEQRGEKIAFTGDQGGIVHITKPNDNNVRTVGQIYYSVERDQSFFYKRESVKGIMRKYDAWGIPKRIVDYVDAVVIETRETGEKVFLEQRDIYKYCIYENSRNLEQKCYVPLKFWKPWQ